MRRSNGARRRTGAIRQLLAHCRASWFFLTLLVVLAAAAILTRHATAQQPQLPMLRAQAVTPAPWVSASRQNYPHAQVMKKPLGTGEQRVWIFVPDAPSPASAPVVIFLHGYGAADPYEYGAWIDHLVRAGNIVLYPVYQKTGMGLLFEGASTFKTNAINGVSAALADLRRVGPVMPDTSRVTMIAHSLGGQIAIALATDGVRRGLPVPAGLLAVETGEKSSSVGAGELRALPPSMMLLSVEGDADQLAASRNGRKLVTGAAQIPLARRGYVLLRSENLNGRHLDADHFAPLLPMQAYRLEKTTPEQIAREQAVKQRFHLRNGETDELDVNGFWRLGDALIRFAPQPGATIADVLNAAGIKPLAQPAQGSPTAVEWAVTPQ